MPSKLISSLKRLLIVFFISFNAQAILIQSPFEDVISASEYMLLNKADEAEWFINYFVMDKEDFLDQYEGSFELSQDVDMTYSIVLSTMIDRCLFLRGFTGASGGLSLEEIENRSAKAAYHFEKNRGIRSFFIVKGKFLVRNKDGKIPSKTSDCAIAAVRKDKVVILQAAK